MFGHDWEPATATIVASRIKSTSGDGLVSVREFIADVTPASGAPYRTLIQEPHIATNFWPPGIGATVRVHADVKRQKAKFDKSDPQISYKAFKHSDHTAFDALLSQPPAMAAPPPSPAGPARDEREVLDELKASGALTDDEYAAAVAKLGAS